jgi:hypothetical protein
MILLLKFLFVLFQMINIGATFAILVTTPHWMENYYEIGKFVVQWLGCASLVLLVCNHSFGGESK